ncbi:sigma-54 factor interaction domain-containing protein [Actinobacillus porcinus]|uniref:HTH-type transcriptional regulatory protein TyrR n=1 Tax=Actinobacillus porcinus TaxID=51048 RepID=A0ABY6THX8_9PAST|nr:sigma 54-interacting transcriptional regulator [Actinobacillus porcinus]VFY92381.1 sigma-54 factor interaction domain-containing protein [Actinobacillus porcinus]VTU06383.1 sigma-54 factor interaction domain-containing protein [Actinobacillus porcinus]
MTENTPHFSFDDLVAHSPKMRTLVETAKKFAQLDAPLLIQGETGTGKDLIAKACHQWSARRNARFIAVNCAGLPSEDAESEMFGQAKGDKTTQGFFEYADGGTVLLDGIAELSLPLQAKLLRFLTDGSFRRVGEEQEHYANVRVICTSQVPLAQYVEQGKVRSDLFHRLNVLTLDVPPLRERQADMADLVNLFVTQISSNLRIETPRFNTDFLEFLNHYPWEGNVRELYNALYRACSLAENNQLSIVHLNLQLKSQQANPSTEINLAQFGEATLDDIMANYEKQVLSLFYAKYPSTRKLAARLGVSHTAVANKLKQYGIGK